jgi:hypothetical protein
MTAPEFLKANLLRLPPPREPWEDHAKHCATPKPEKVTLEQHMARLPAGLKHHTQWLDTK